MGDGADRADRRTTLRALLHDVLTGEVGATRVGRLCPRCGSGAHGAPWVRVTRSPAPTVSLSYADDLAVVAWGWAGPVGVDVERDGPPLDGVGDRAAWTRHEALAKASGLGLDARPAAELPGLPTAPLDLPPGYVGTIAGHAVRHRVVRHGVVRAPRTGPPG